MINTASSFVSYILTSDEYLAGSVLSLIQKQVIQNQIAQAAEEKLNLTFIPENATRDAELQGRILALKYLLDVSESIEAADRNKDSSASST
jgi:hypothetical protein